MEKLKSRKFWIALFTGGSLIASALFGVEIPKELIDALTLICVTAVGSIGVVDSIKVLK